MDNEERMGLLSQLITDAHIEYQRRNRKTISQARFAKHIGVSPPSLSQWISRMRLPQGDNVHKLAAALGPKVYDIVGLPRMMPMDDDLRALYDVWYDLGDERDQIMGIIRAHEAKAIEKPQERDNEAVSRGGRTMA